MTRTLWILALVASTCIGCASGRDAGALGDGCSVCDLTDDAAGKAAGGGPSGSSGVDQVQAPYQGDKGPRLNAKTSTGQGGLWSSDTHKESGQLGTGGNQYQGILNYLPGVGMGGGGASPLEISLAKSLVSNDKRMSVATTQEQYELLATERSDLLDRLERAGSCGSGKITNNFWLHGSKAQILGLSKATADNGKGSDDEAKFAAGADAAAKTAAHVMAPENGKNVPDMPTDPGAKKPIPPLQPVPVAPDLPKPAPSDDGHGSSNGGG